MKRYLLSIIVSLALICQIILPVYPGGWSVPVAQADIYDDLTPDYNESDDSDVQASVSPSQVYPDPNKSITLTYNISDRGYAGDWYIQVNNWTDPGGSAPFNILLKKNLTLEKKDGKISGSWTIPVWWLSPTAPSNANSPITVGWYEFRIYGPQGVADSPVTHKVNQNHLFNRSGFSVVNPNNIQLTCPGSAQPMDKVTVSWQGTVSDPNAWIGFFKKDSADTASPIFSTKQTGISGNSWTRELNVSPGIYNYRLFQYNRVCGKSNDIVIAFPDSPIYNPTINVQPTSAHPGDTITVTWSNAPPISDTDYDDMLCLYQYWYGGTENDQFKGQFKSGIDSQGTYQYKLPPNLAAGKYDIKIKNFLTNQVVGTSGYFTVLAPSSTAPSTTTGTSGTSSTLQLVATANSQSINLSWTAPSYSKTVKGFYPYRSTTPGGQTSTPLTDFPVNGTSYIDQNVKTGTTYYYILKPVFSDSSLGAASNEASATPGTTTTTGAIVLQVGKSAMTVNGATKEIDPGQGTAPEIRYSRVCLPIRAVIEALGGSVAWNAAKQQVTITSGATTIVLWIGQENAQVNGQTKTLDVAPYLSKTGRTMLPLRFITENLGYQVKWDGTTQSVTIACPPSTGSPGGERRLQSGTGPNLITPIQHPGLPTP